MAKDILLQSERLEALLVPLDRLATQLRAAESSENATLLSAAAELLGDGGLAVASPPAPQQPSPWPWPSPSPSPSPPSPSPPSPSPPSPPQDGGVASVCFPADVLRPLASVAEDLAAAQGVTFVAVIEQELPGLRVPELALREAVRCCTPCTLCALCTLCVSAPAAPSVPSASAHPLRQVSNLVDNGLKYCEAPSGAARYLGLCCRWDEAEDRISICVWNSAAPLPQEELLGAFAWGERGSAAASSRVGGSGFGLPIVRRLVSLMGGSVAPLANEPLPEWLSAALPPDGEEGREPDERPHGVSGCIYLPRNPG